MTCRPGEMLCRGSVTEFTESTEEDGIKMSKIAIAAAVLAVLNLVSFGLMAYDKRCARAGRWRVPEKTLFLAAACFGALGGVLGMQLCRHKTRHWYFKVFFPLMLLAQAALLVWGYTAFLTP